MPAGLLLAGVLGPQLTEWTGWRVTMLASAAASLAFALMLHPLCRLSILTACHRELFSFRISAQP